MNPLTQIIELATQERPNPEQMIDYREGVEARLDRIAEVARAALGDTPPVFAVDVDGREDGTFLFADHDAAAAFADAVSVNLYRAHVEDAPINRGKGAEELIAKERGDQIEDFGYPISADAVRGCSDEMTAILASFEASPEGNTEEGAKVKELLRRWIQIDASRAKEVGP